MTTATAANSMTATGPRTRGDAFAALRVRNYRIYLAGNSIAGTGTWMQSVAQDWLVHELTGSAAAVGITMACQFLPVLLLGMHGGMIADRYPSRTILMVTQGVNGTLSAVLAVLTITGAVHPVHIYLLALAFGLVFVVDNPARQVFVNEVVPARYLRNAIALSAAVLQATRLVGPGVAGVLIGTAGTGWAFAANALCYVGPTIGLARMRSAELLPAPTVHRAPGQLRSALGHVAARPHVAWTIGLVAVMGTFGLNFPVVLTAMAGTTFHGDAGLYGLFNIVLAAGSVAGALVAGARLHTRLRLLITLAGAFGLAQAAAAFAPGIGAFLVALAVMGAANLAFQALANSSVQMGVDPAFRSRVMGLYLLALTGGSPLGAPLVGWITAHAGPRIGMAVCGIVPALAALAVGVLMIVRRGRPHHPPRVRPN